MLTIRKTTGSIAEVIAAIRDVPVRLIPYAASTALTRTAQIAAKKDLPDAMRAVFDRPTAYALNSLFVQPSTVKTQSARVMVKDTTSSKGVVPEKFLFPGVEGGMRNEKRFEKSLRYAGLLPAGHRVMPGDDIELDASGNISTGLIRSVIAFSKKVQPERKKPRTAKEAKAQQRALKQANPKNYVFLPSKNGRSPVLAQRTGKVLSKLFGFVKTEPNYTKRLDFEAIVLKCANDNFETEFNRAFDEFRAKGKA